MNIIAKIVVAGNVRRSAQIAIGDCDDVEYLRAKRWDLGGIPNWRAMSNNSVVCSDVSQLPDEFWEGYNGNGEPYGLINLDASRRMGRTGEEEYPDPDVQGFNPCAEQSLANYETCCLAEIYLPNINSYEELKKVARYLYRINKHSLAIKCEVKETEDIVHKNMRMGIGVTGYLQATEEQRNWLTDCYIYLRSYDKEYSQLAGYPASIKLTTVKPSGTLSLLAGVTPGAHPGYSEYYIRRIRMAADSSLALTSREHGYPVEYVLNFDGTEDKSTIVVSFPCKFPSGTTFAQDLTAIDQLEVCKRLQTEWSDNAVSVTIYYRKEELESIKGWLENNYFNVKSVSFLLHNDHGFKQAPLEEIDEGTYLDMKSSVTPITSLEQLSMDDIEIADCDSGACPVR
jgi:adenosylcobalamin-dependent ribonucleoside-triphosphate reductase